VGRVTRRGKNMMTRSNCLIGVLALLTACGVASRPDENNNECGDGRVANTEQCDDGNTDDGDGCSSSCKSESNPATCGDGALGNGESCDDGNAAAGDGCSATCGVEQGYSCTGSPSVCTSTQATSGTCGSPFTVALAASATDPTILEGTGSGDTTSSTNQVAEGPCDGFDSGAGKDHVWKFTLTDTRDVMILMDEELSTFDTVIRVMSVPCDVGTEISEFAGADGCADQAGAAEFMGWVSMGPGTYYVVIDGWTADDVGMYTFHIAALPPGCGNGVADPLEFCDDGNLTSGEGCTDKCEVEPDYTCTDASGDPAVVEPSVCTLDTTSSAVPPAPGDLVINEFMAADNMSDTNCDGVITGTGDEFVELVNVSTKTLDLADVTLADSLIVRHVFAAGTTLAPGKAIVVWNAGTPACAGVTNFAVASTGQLGLNDAGDTIKVADAAAVMIATTTYGAATTNVSFNLSTEMSGSSYVLHNNVGGAVGMFSPGKHADGSAF
jgi:cysteine-rich repeat protein